MTIFKVIETDTDFVDPSHKADTKTLFETSNLKVARKFAEEYKHRHPLLDIRVIQSIK